MVSLSVRRSLHELDVQQLSLLLVHFAEIGQAWQDFISNAHSPFYGQRPSLACVVEISQVPSCP